MFTSPTDEILQVIVIPLEFPDPQEGSYGEALNYPDGPRAYWRPFMVGRLFSDVDGHVMTLDEYEEAWDEMEAGNAQERDEALSHPGGPKEYYRELYVGTDRAPQGDDMHPMTPEEFEAEWAGVTAADDH